MCGYVVAKEVSAREYWNMASEPFASDDGELLACVRNGFIAAGGKSCEVWSRLQAGPAKSWASLISTLAPQMSAAINDVDPGRSFFILPLLECQISCALNRSFKFPDSIHEGNGKRGGSTQKVFPLHSDMVLMHNEYNIAENYTLSAQTRAEATNLGTERKLVPEDRRAIVAREMAFLVPHCGVDLSSQQSSDLAAKLGALIPVGKCAGRTSKHPEGTTWLAACRQLRADLCKHDKAAHPKLVIYQPDPGACLPACADACLRLLGSLGPWRGRFSLSVAFSVSSTSCAGHVAEGESKGRVRQSGGWVQRGGSTWQR